ncbi:Putative mycofactocin biosynthesis glycosyltransferase MftF [Roseibaca ekhonensis]|jgi:GT2 family glycosyltransferase|uniref:Mycofactocin biosynthesis glycosyltransferase MftF n=1 Tax=Roseinatronobacter ekhonensis TaxID=254356 RepID=A0A3B0M2Z5_9RHOB|nr:glycosyltransferase [Roseibaca ekhonensis]SUZ30522.1 Putative mycofactocin biosynthesis glycosyltransferase MftF [Roseibaca ekhonensis]
MEREFDAVVIGRNEGARLLRALSAAQAVARRVIYVDSGSKDGSPDAARGLGVTVLELDPSRPFTAARGRNAGLAALPDAEFVQFIDGDCVLDPDWAARALAHLHETPRAGLVFGRQFEAAPDASIYNWMTDWEWNKPLGPDTFCAGCLMVRTDVLRGIGGYNEGLIAGEDDDMCLRMQAAGWQTWCIEARMTEHDARLLSLAPWWRRSLRAGHSYAELGVLHGAAAGQRRRALIWGIGLPVLALAGLVLWWPVALGVVALYSASIARQWRRFRSQDLGAKRALQAASLLMLSKFAEAAGMASYWLARTRGQRRRLIEYK